MNKQINKRLVRKAYQHFKAGDIHSVLNVLAEDVLWELPDMANVPFAGTWQGRQQVVTFFRRLVESQEVIEFEPEEFISQGDEVVVLGHFTMRVRATARNSRSAWVHVWTVKNGKATRVREYVDSLAVSRAHTTTQTG
jgi:ketosteroid isomerase-like protein